MGKKNVTTEAQGSSTEARLEEQGITQHAPLVKKEYQLTAKKEQTGDNGNHGSIVLVFLTRKEAITIGTTLKRAGWTVKAEVETTRTLDL